MWVREWILRRKEHVYYETLLKELRSEDANFYKNFVRVTPSDFDFLL